MTNTDKKEAQSKRITFFKTNRPFAVFALIVIVILSCCISMARTRASLRNDVEEAYTDVEAYEIDVKDNLSKMTVSASHLLAIYKAEAGEDELYADCESALSAVCDSLESPFWSSDHVKALSGFVYSIHYSLITSFDLNEQIKNSETSYYYDFDSKLSQLSNAEEYNNAARAYNNAAQAFPLSLVISDTAAVYD